jgi:hypothetical protein
MSLSSSHVPKEFRKVVNAGVLLDIMGFALANEWFLLTTSPHQIHFKTCLG